MYIYIYNNNNYINNIIYCRLYFNNDRQNPVSACCCVSCFETTHPAPFRVSEKR